MVRLTAMLTHFGVRNFKSIRQLDLEMRPFMVLVGPNGSGKTNVVHAAELFGQVLERGTTDPVREQGWDRIIRREKKPARGGLSFSAKVLLPDDVLEWTHQRAAGRGRRHLTEQVTLEGRLELAGSVGADEIRVTREEIVLEANGGARARVATKSDGDPAVEGDDELLWMLFDFGLFTHASRAADKLDRRALVQFLSDTPRSHALPRATPLRLLNWQRLSSPALRSLVNTCAVTRLRLDASSLRSDSVLDRAQGRELLGPTGSGLAQAVDRLRSRARGRAGSFERVLSALQKVYPRIEDVTAKRIQPGRMTLEFKERGIKEPLGLGNVSDGVLHALALLVMLESDQPHRMGGSGVLAIEEPENAIHPWSLRSIVERAQEPSARQVLITTHSPVVVDAVKDPGALFVVDHEDRRGTTVTAARDREVALDTILRTTGQKLGAVWMAGGVGGTPRNSP